MGLRHAQFREILDHYRGTFSIARELNLRDASLPMLVGMMPTMSSLQVAEVVLILLRMKTKQRRRFACTVVDGLVYLERVDTCMPMTIAMVCDRMSDLSELAACIDVVHEEQQSVTRRMRHAAH